MKEILLLEDKMARIDNIMLGGKAALDAIGRLDLLPDIQTEAAPHTFDKALAAYQLVIIHTSWLKERGLYNTLTDYMRGHGEKRFILFSGGTYQNQVINSGQGLIIGSETLYRQELPAFLEHYPAGDAQSLLKFLYGEQWRLSLLLQLQQIRWKAALSTKRDDEGEPTEDTIQEDKILGVLQMESITDEQLSQMIDEELKRAE